MLLKEKNSVLIRCHVSVLTDHLMFMDIEIFLKYFNPLVYIFDNIYFTLSICISKVLNLRTYLYFTCSHIRL